MKKIVKPVLNIMIPIILFVGVSVVTLSFGINGHLPTQSSVQNTDVKLALK